MVSTAKPRQVLAHVDRTGEGDQAGDRRQDERARHLVRVAEHDVQNALGQGRRRGSTAQTDRRSREFLRPA